MFVNRIEELELLENRIRSRRAEFIVLSTFFCTGNDKNSGLSRDFSKKFRKIRFWNHDRRLLWFLE